MLSLHIVHGDLSPYNILLHDNRLVIIDFPQAVDPRKNGQAEMLLVRDVTNVCAYFKRQGLKVDGAEVGADLWQRYSRARLRAAGT
jgi:RIO kinase 1